MSDIRNARDVVVAAYLGWTLDAFDFFIMIFVFDDVAKTFGVGLTVASLAITLTLLMRAIGAFIFGRLADRYGRRPVMMANILLFSLLELMSGLAPTLLAFMVLRALFGIAMGGEWGVGSSLTMETVPARWRGWVSGLLQAGYPSGYLLATIAYGVLDPYIHWRGLFIVGALPALLVVYIRRNVPESPDWRARQRAPKVPIMDILRRHAGLTVYAVILMMAFNFFSHGTQDIYPKAFLKAQHGFSHTTITIIAITYNIGAILGGLTFGSLSQRIGRRRAIVIAALLSLPVIPLWAFSNSPWLIGLGAFLMQFMVQGAWGVIPAHLNELSPGAIRSTFPGFVYQLGNFFASYNATLQTKIGVHYGNHFSYALAGVAGTVAVVIALLVGFGVENRDLKMGSEGLFPTIPPD
jgi:SHS family lactate transporter-like MFS transporter